MNRLPWMLNARKEELLLGFLEVAGSTPFPSLGVSLRLLMLLLPGTLSWTEGSRLSTSGAHDLKAVI